jgi:hypothetical protein
MYATHAMWSRAMASALAHRILECYRAFATTDSMLSLQLRLLCQRV